MLPAGSRLRHSAEFSDVVRRGRRVSRQLLTVHLLTARAPESGAAPSGGLPGGSTQAGLVVSKAVGGSVVRSRTARRLRHLLRARLAALPVGSRLVVRAGSTAGSASSAALAADLDAALSAALRPARPRVAR